MYVFTAALNTISNLFNVKLLLLLSVITKDPKNTFVLFFVNTLELGFVLSITTLPALIVKLVNAGVAVTLTGALYATAVADKSTASSNA
jgi:hypothetical protein